MSEISDTFKGLKEHNQNKRASNRYQSAEYLRTERIPFTVYNNGAHLIVEGDTGYIDLWPGTGMWICRATQKRGFGVRNLANFIKTRQEG